MLLTFFVKNASVQLYVSRPQLLFLVRTHRQNRTLVGNR